MQQEKFVNQQHNPPTLASGNGAAQITMNSELTRKLLHICSLAIPIFYYFVTRETALMVLIPFTLISLFFDFGRYYIGWVEKFVSFAFGAILREHERDKSRKLLSGATYVILSGCLCVLLFPKMIVITAFTILIICDTASALLGRKFGKHTFLDKSLEGTLAFFLFGFIVVIVAPKVLGMWEEYAIGFAAAIVSGIIEAMSVRLRVDDNFSVPISAGFVMWFGYYLLSVVDPLTYAHLYQTLTHF
jgi:dolichol kinase